MAGGDDLGCGLYDGHLCLCGCELGTAEWFGQVAVEAPGHECPVYSSGRTTDFFSSFL